MGKAGKIVRLIRVMRIMRIFKLVRHFAGLQSLIYTLNQVSSLKLKLLKHRTGSRSVIKIHVGTEHKTNGVSSCWPTTQEVAGSNPAMCRTLFFSITTFLHFNIRPSKRSISTYDKKVKNCIAAWIKKGLMNTE